MSAIPQDAKKVTAEGRDVASAVAKVAEELGVPANQVGWELDKEHFRSTSGSMVPKSTVKVIGWVRPEGAPSAPVRAAAPAPSEGEERPHRAERDRDRPRDRDRDRPRDRDRDRPRDRDRDRPRAAEREGERPRAAEREGERPRAAERDRDEARKPEGLRGAESGTTPASDYAAEWFRTLLGHMDIVGTVEGTGAEGRVHLRVRADKAGRLIGKRGTTLAAIRHLLRLALERDHGAPVVDVDVDDERTGEERAEEPRRAARPSDRPRRDRDDRGPRRDRDRDRGDDEKGRLPEGKLRALARRAAEKAIETGKPITINLELNSYDRRIVHMEISEIEGVSSRSEERGAGKIVQIVPE